MSTLSFAFSVLAIIISAVSVWYTKRTYEKSLEPILTAEVVIDHRKKVCALRLLNDGSNNIHRIEIRKACFLFDRNARLLSKMSKLSSFPSWAKLELLRPGKEQMLPIGDDEVKDVFRNEATWRDAEDEQKPFIGIMKFSITFRRNPDRKEFKVMSSLFVVKESTTGELVPEEQEAVPPFIKNLEKQTDEG